MGEELRFLCLLGTLQTLPRPFTIQPPPASWVAAPPSCALISPNLCLDPSCSVTSPCLCIHSHLRPGEGAKLFLPEDLTQVSPVLQLPPGHRRTPQALVKMSGLCSENNFAALSRARPVRGPSISPGRMSSALTSHQSDLPLAQGPRAHVLWGGSSRPLLPGSAKAA